MPPPPPTTHPPTAPTAPTAQAAQAAQAAGWHLESIAGPELPPVGLHGRETLRVGRGRQNEVYLPDPAVSRLHATLSQRGERWFLTDESSRHGTKVNGVRLEPGWATVLSEADVITIGPWTLRVRPAGAGWSTAGLATGSTAGPTGAQAQGGTRLATVVRAEEPGERVERINEAALGRLAQQRLGLLLECAAAVHGAGDEASLAEALVRAALAGSGFGRAALLRTGPGWTAAAGPEDGAAHGLWNEGLWNEGLGIEILCALVRRPGGATPETRAFPVSASLIAEASSGLPARLGGWSGGGGGADVGHSITDLRIHTALCVPLLVGERVDAYLYLDARGGESVVEADAAEFCTALARMGGLAMANRRREELEARQKTLVAQLGAAREAQQLIVPPPSGRVAGLAYSLRMRPGMFVAGDLFDIMELADGRAAFFLGDVTGEGVGAGILMASAQSHLHALLMQHADPERAVNVVNRYLAEHTPPDRFISLWVGVLDRASGTVAYVDAGHGYAVHVPAGGAPRVIAGSGGGIPAAIEPGFVYHAQSMAFGPGDRLVLFSDGIAEQTPKRRDVAMTMDNAQAIEEPGVRAPGQNTRPRREEFGMTRVIEVLGRSRNPEEDTRRLLAAVLEYAGTEALSDDTTIASLLWPVEGA